MTTTEPPANRALPVTGGHNLRDLGGYETSDGRHVKWRMLYRSGAIYGLDDDARAYMRQLGITAICDLRTPHERQHRPMDWHDGLDVHYYGGVPLESGARLEALLVSGMALREQMLERMRGIYRKLPFEQASSYRHLFAMLVKGHVPLLFNCSAGKDRTGVAAALILTALGIPRETIVHDYMLSNETAEGLLVMMTERTPRFAELLAADPEALRPVLHADISYLDIAFTAIEQRYGSVDAYLEQHLGVGAAGRAALRQYLLD
jgi:protein-tyrosine phosphatase